MKSILLVEDDPALRSALMEGLGEEGYDVTEAGNGQQALDALRDINPDIVLTDLAMPEMDGIELISRLHNEYARQFCIIAMTGGIGAAEVVRPDYVLLKAAEGLGAEHTIEKPFRLKALLDLLAAVKIP